MTHEESAVSGLSQDDIAGGIRPRLLDLLAARPRHRAVVDEDTALTLEQLLARATRVAEALDEEAVGAPDEPVATVCRHDAAAVATLVGILLSGHPVLVMDALTPPARLAGQLRHLGATLCVTDEHTAQLAQAVADAAGGRTLLSLAGTPAADGQPWADSPVWTRPLDPTAVAALGFTSGSTGTPKVVALDHRHLVGDAWAASSLDDCIGPDDVVAHTLPLAFAAGMNVTMAGLLSGATMAMYDTRTRGIAGLADWVRASGVSVLNASPAILRALLAGGPDPAALHGLRSLTLSGEAAHDRDVVTARAALPPGCTIFHRFGSTETGLIAHLVLPSDAPVPDGRLSVGPPSGSTRVRLVDDDGAPTAPGAPGIVEVTRSAYLASGYWRDPERTAAQFTDHPDGSRSYLSNDLARFDDEGRLWLLGRRDHSVKVRGYLVEPGEVDAALFADPDIAEAVTVGVPRPDGPGNRLISYVVSRAERPGAAAVRAHLRAVLPAHMVPESVVFLQALPRTERGKIDRAALPTPPPPAGSEPPRTEWEIVVAQVWARALEVDDVARDADFFELGGDSLAAEALVAMTESDLGVPKGQVSAATLVEAPTVAEFAARARRRPSRDRQTVTVLREGGAQPPLFLVAGGGGLGVSFVPIARHLPADRPVYALHAHALEVRGIPDWSVEAIARRHIATMRSVQPEGPYHLGGHSFGGVVAFEMAQQLRRAGHEVALLAVVDSFPPDPALLPALPPRSLLRRLRDGVGLAVTGLVPTPGMGQYWRFHRQSQWLSEHYRSEPYPGRTLVLVADSPERQARSQWEAHLSGPWELLEVPGDHQAILREPHARTVAAALADALDPSRRVVGGAEHA